MQRIAATVTGPEAPGHGKEMIEHQQIQKAMEALVVLLADSNAYTRRLTRTMLTNLGIKSIYESVDGIAALEAIRLGVNEFLVKPISPKTLQQRLLGILLNPRPMVRAGKYYIPMPRRRIDLKEFITAA